MVRALRYECRRSRHLQNHSWWGSKSWLDLMKDRLAAGWSFV